MKVSKERLSVIGRLIGIYREEKRGNSQNEWSQVNFCDDICSPNTLKNIELGNVGRSYEIYQILLAKYDLQLGEFPLIDNAINSLLDSIHTAIEYYDIKKIDSLTIKGIKLLETARGFVYYEELLEFFNDIRNYYLNLMVISERRVFRYMSIFHLFNKSTEDIMKLLIFAQLKLKSINNMEGYLVDVEKLKLSESDFSCLKINLLYHYYMTKRRFSMMDLLDDLEKEYLKKGNINRLADTYSYAMLMLIDVDEERSLLFIEKANKLIESHVLSDLKEKEVCGNIAAYYHNKKDYKNALDYFQKSSKIGHPSMMFNCIYIADCQNHLKMKIDIPKLKKSEIKKYPDDLKSVYQYFLTVQGSEVPVFLKQKMIMKHILPNLKDTVFIEIFRFELAKIVGETSSYKSLYVFESKVKNII